MSSEEPKDGPENPLKHLKLAQEDLNKVNEILFANGSIVFTSKGNGEYTVTNMKDLASTTSTANGTGNITVTMNGGFMHQEEPKVQPATAENRDRIYKAFADHINATLHEENQNLKRTIETSSRSWRSLEAQNLTLHNRNQALERDARALALLADARAAANKELERKFQNASASLQTMWENHAELTEAHEALRAVVRGLEESDDFNDTIADYEKQVDTLNTELEQCEADKRQLEAVCDSQLARAKNDVAFAEARLEAEESRRASDWTFCQNKIKDLEAKQLPDWERLTLAEKIDRMNSGMTVWQISTGEGPFRTVMEQTVKGEGGSTFGMRCRPASGKDKGIEVTDLTPYAPVKPVTTKPGLALCGAQLAASFLTALAVSLAASPVAVMVMAVLSFVLTATLVHKARKAC